ncbi:hypothetical protein HD806DRAFT_545864 [Xylariaceae sp. AK1471]|nr:hypothetical protein HD806DRAFT_545864 [Xylariaceae sp. AK1471]
MFAFLIKATWLLAVVSANSLRASSPCPPINNGTVTINSYQLYPENADFDRSSCLLCTLIYTIPDIGALYNASVVVYDPYKDTVVSTLEFPHITRTSPFHIGAVAWDRYNDNGNDEITILVDAAPAHETAGRDVSGDNYILRYSATSNKLLWSVNLTATTKGRYGGPQDIEHDYYRNIFVLGTYPGTIIRVAAGGRRVDEWYVPPINTTEAVGYTGLAAVSGDMLLVTDARNNSAEGGALYTFNMSEKKGTPKRIPIVNGRPLDTNISYLIHPADAIYLPPKYDNGVLLVAEHGAGVSVLHSVIMAGTRWRSAAFLGRIPNPPDVAASGAIVTGAVEIAGRVFMIEEWFTDALVPGTSAGNRTLFPLVDITDQLDALI